MRDRRAAGRGSVLFLCSKQSAPTPDPSPRAFRAGEGNPASLRLSSIVPALPCESALQAKTAASPTLLRAPLPLAPRPPEAGQPPRRGGEGGGGVFFFFFFSRRMGFGHPPDRGDRGICS